MRRNYLALAAATLCAVMCGVTPAFASSFNLGTGSNPSVAVDSSGTAHVAWLPASGPQAVLTCTIPAGASGCSGTPATLTFAGPEETGTTGAPPQIFVSGSTVVVTVGAGNGASSHQYVWTSTDGGATYSPAVAAGTILAEDSAFVPSSGLLVNGTHLGGASLSGGENFAEQANPIGGPTNTSYAALEPKGFHNDTTESVTGVSGSNAVVAWNDAANPQEVFFSYLRSGTPFTQAALNTTGNWANGNLSDGGTDLGMSGGPSGLYLLEAVFAHGGYPQLRRWDGASTFSAPYQADCGDVSHYGAGLQDENLFEEPASGVLSLLYSVSDGSSKTLRYIDLLPGNGGYSQSAPITVDAGDAYLMPRVGANAAGSGLAVWFTAFGSGSQIHASWFSAPARNGCGGGTPTAKSHTTATKAHGLRLLVTVPTACVASGGSIAVTIAFQGHGFKIKSIKATAGKGKTHKTRHGGVLQLPVGKLAKGTSAVHVVVKFRGAHKHSYTIKLASSFLVC